jgi:hypothetical protein
MLAGAASACAFALPAVARKGDVPEAALSALRRVSKHWQSGDKCRATIHLAQSGLDKGVASRVLRQELGLGPVQVDVSKCDENQPGSTLT